MVSLSPEQKQTKEHNCMKRLWMLPAVLIFSAGFITPDDARFSGQENIEFVCLKAHKASNTCHFNFTVDGANYRYVDIGCKYAKKQEELIKKVKDGDLFLAKDWKIDCPVKKSE